MKHPVTGQVGGFEIQLSAVQVRVLISRAIDPSLGPKKIVVTTGNNSHGVITGVKKLIMFTIAKF